MSSHCMSWKSRSMHNRGSSSLGWNGGRKIPARSVRYWLIAVFPLSKRFLRAEACRQDRRGPLADGLCRQGRQRAGLAIDAVRRQAAGCGADGEDKTALGIEAERARNGLGRDLPGGG